REGSAAALKQFSFCTGGHRLGLKLFSQRRSPDPLDFSNVDLNYLGAIAFDSQSIGTNVSQQSHLTSGCGDYLFDIAQEGLIEADYDARGRLAEEASHNVMFTSDVDVGANCFTIQG